MLNREKKPSPTRVDALISAQTEGDLRPKDQETLIVERRRGRISDRRVNEIVGRRKRRTLTAQQIDALIFHRYHEGKKLDEFVVQTYGVLTLYRNDLGEILHLFHSVAADVSIVLDEYIIESTDDIIKIRKHKTDYLSVTSKTPDISLELRGNSATLSLGCADTPDQLLFATKLHDLLLSKQGVHLPYFFGVLAVPILVFDQILPRVRDTLSTRTYNIIALLCIAAVAYALLSEHRWRYAHTKIHLCDTPNNWLERHKETILVGVLTAFGGFVAITVVPQIITWLTNLPK